MTRAEKRPARRAAGLGVALLAATSLAGANENKPGAAELAVAEAFVSAFYSFQPEPLSDLLAKAGESKEDILFYQGWALGGNYIVMQRMPCAPGEDNTIRCSITVQDDLVLALGIDFDVTDTFTLRFSDGAISAVETSSNDPELYHDARDWVWENRRDWVEIPCNGSEKTAADAGQCVRSMLRGYRDYADLNALTPRAAR